MILKKKYTGCAMDEPKPVNCGCGGEVWAFMTLYPENPERPYICQCRNCFTRTGGYPTEAEAITAWNRAMGAEVTFKYEIGRRSGKTLERAIDFLRRSGWLQEHDRALTQIERTAKVMNDGINYCENCEGYVEAPMAYCPYCGCRLEWE